MGNQFLGLSLFIMLLSFFIILNTMSNFEATKAKPVLNSLTMAFATKKTTSDQAPGQNPQPATTTQLGSTLDRIESLFQSKITTATTKQNRFGTTMYVRLPFKDFQGAIEKSLDPAPSTPQRPFANPENDDQELDMLPMLVSLLETQRGIPYKMDMVLNIDQEPAEINDENPAKFNEYNKSLSSITQKIETAGLPKKQISMGLKRGQADTVELIFRQYRPFNPNPDFTKTPQLPLR